eukprot:6187987-Pleurochrysis_carterae.AAC.6
MPHMQVRTGLSPLVIVDSHIRMSPKPAGSQSADHACSNVGFVRAYLHAREELMLIMSIELCAEAPAASSCSRRTLALAAVRHSWPARMGHSRATRDQPRHKFDGPICAIAVHRASSASLLRLRNSKQCKLHNSLLFKCGGRVWMLAIEGKARLQSRFQLRQKKLLLSRLHASAHDGGARDEQYAQVYTGGAYGCEFDQLLAHASVRA